MQLQGLHKCKLSSVRAVNAVARFAQVKPSPWYCVQALDCRGPAEFYLLIPSTMPSTGCCNHNAADTSKMGESTTLFI